MSSRRLGAALPARTSNASGNSPEALERGQELRDPLRGVQVTEAGHHREVAVGNEPLAETSTAGHAGIGITQIGPS